MVAHLSTSCLWPSIQRAVHDLNHDWRPTSKSTVPCFYFVWCNLACMKFGLFCYIASSWYRDFFCCTLFTFVLRFLTVLNVSIALTSICYNWYFFDWCWYWSRVGMMCAMYVLSRPHTLHGGGNSRSLPSTVTVMPGDVNSPYHKQFVHSKSQQYRRLKTEWRNNVYLRRSNVQVHCRLARFILYFS